MSYTGNVAIGGDADVRELPHLTISKLAVGAYDNNAYLLRCRSTGSQVLVDAAAEPDRLLDLIGPDGITAVITTHSHGDHWAGLAEVLVATGAEHLAGEFDAPDIEVPATSTLADGDTVMVGALPLHVIHLRGHTPGAIALLYDDPEGQPHLLTGDCLFPGGVGNTWDDPERFAMLLGDVTEKIFTPLPDETWVYPGHGGDTTVGAERPHLAEWAERGW